MLDVNAIRDMIETMTERTRALRGYLDYTERKERLAEVELELSEPGVWNDADKAQALGRERAALQDVVGVIDRLESGLSDAAELFELAAGEDDAETLSAIRQDLEKLDRELSRLEFRRMFSGEMDSANCFVEIQAGSGGTEAQDWAEMLLRMYLRWAERRGFETEIIEISEGEVAGIKGATFAMRGDHAYGWIRTETGIHRLVRKSPFDSGARRHTSFASVFISPEIDDDIEIEINPSDVRTDTYRASGAGGQHINKTDSAVRLTHVPTNTVVACQTERSQHQNRDKAWKQLRAKLYELELQKRRSAAQEVEDSKSDIGWGHQIRSYVLDQSRVKDLRTGVEISSPDTVLDGDIDEFIEASLKSAL
ncbi:MAG: peptide chain release factor 2 [Gammaproteobacteria bacterium]|nr:peptide chain release factor 2 [Gammaproteobacteria bacterium]